MVIDAEEGLSASDLVAGACRSLRRSSPEPRRQPWCRSTQRRSERLGDDDGAEKDGYRGGSTATLDERAAR